MAVPKKRTSKSKRDFRRKTHKAVAINTKKCKKCGKDTKPHQVCVSCGNYNK